MALGVYFLTRNSPKSLRNRGNAPLLLIGMPGRSTSIIGDECAKKNAGIFGGEEGRSSSALSHSSLVFGAVAVMGWKATCVRQERGGNYDRVSSEGYLNVDSWRSVGD